MKYLTSSFIISFSLCCIGMFFLSCSNTTPELISVDATIVYDYQSLQESPIQRLSVFAQSSDGTERIMSLKISYPEEKLFWLVDKPLILNNGSKLWAGSPGLMSPYFSAFPQGQYQVIYTDLAGKTATRQFVLNYQEVLAPPLEQPIFFSQQEDDAQSTEDSADEPIRKVALFSESDGRGTLLFFDKAWNDWQSFTDIKDSYNKAKSLRICLDYPSRQVRYLLPAHNFE